MRIELTKGRDHDTTAIERGDGSQARFTFPKKGPIPHDAAHFFVESTLGMNAAFWGIVAQGTDPQDVARIAAAGGHASATRAQVPDDTIVELVQAERLVECFEAEFWSHGSDDSALLSVARAGWEASHVPEVSKAERALATIRAKLRAFAREWQELKLGDSMVLDWETSS